MMEYIMLIIKCLIVYFISIFALRIMGKREVGELSVFDIVIYLVMSELLAISISEPNETILKSLIPISTLAILQIIISWILLKSKKIRDVFDGKSVILIHNGHINQEKMRNNRYNIDDLMSQIRAHDLCSPNEVAFAILENSGQLSILPKKDCKVKYPSPLISDGLINDRALEDIHHTREWLIQKLKEEGVENPDDVFLCLWEKSSFYIVKKELNSRNKLF